MKITYQRFLREPRIKFNWKIDVMPYWRIQKKFKSKEIYVLDIDYVHNTILAHVR